jgi:hypothetical protein
MDLDVNGYTSPWGFLSPLLNLCLIFPDTIMFTSTSIALLIIVSRFVDLLSLNNKAKSLSKESVYHNCAAPGGGWTSTRIELYTFMKRAENSCTVSYGTFFMLFYYVNNCKGFFLSPHMVMKVVLNTVKS